MRLSELIQRLQEALEKHGDSDVLIVGREQEEDIQDVVWSRDSVMIWPNTPVM